MPRTKRYKFKIWASIEREDTKTGEYTDLASDEGDADSTVEVGHFTSEQAARDALAELEFMMGAPELVRE